MLEVADQVFDGRPLVFAVQRVRRLRSWSADRSAPSKTSRTSCSASRISPPPAATGRPRPLVTEMLPQPVRLTPGAVAPSPPGRPCQGNSRSTVQSSPLRVVAEAVVEAVAALLPELERRRRRGGTRPSRRGSGDRVRHSAASSSSTRRASSSREASGRLCSRSHRNDPAARRSRAWISSVFSLALEWLTVPSIRTWRPGGSQWKSIAARGFSASSRPLRLA